MKIERNHISGLIIIVFHLAGALLLTSESWRAETLKLTPFNLALTTAIFIYINKFNFSKQALGLLYIFGLGLIVEIIGVSSGLIFGEYSYGDNLGFKVGGVPLLIGFNWLLLTIGARDLVSFLKLKSFLAFSLSAVLIVLLDFLIEPVAIKFDYWTWQNVEVPVQNYIMWGLIAFVMQYILAFNSIKTDRKLSVYFFISQVIFFGILNLEL